MKKHPSMEAHNVPTVVSTPSVTIDDLIDLTMQSLSSTSQDVYKSTYGQWCDWCHNQDIDPLHLSPVNIFAFLESLNVTKKTRHRQMSFMRKLIYIFYLATGDENIKRVYGYMRTVKPPQGNLRDFERSRHALTPEEVHRLLTAWNFDDKPINVRNHAVIAMLFATGARRSELGKMEWRDLNWDDATVWIRHGKGDKARVVSIIGDLAIRALEAWRALIPEHRWMFCPLTHGNEVGPDKFMSGHVVYHIVKRTEKLCGIELTPHTARRTLITEALIQGATLSDVQAQAGHSGPAMTLRYAQPGTARERRNRIKLRYGD